MTSKDDQVPVLLDPELRLEPEGSGLLLTIVGQGESVELGWYSRRALRLSLRSLLQLDFCRPESAANGVFQGHSIRDGVSSASYRTLYTFQAATDRLGFAVQSKDAEWIAQGVLDAGRRAAWLAALRAALNSDS